MRTNLFPNPRNLASDSTQSWGQWIAQYASTAPTVANTGTYFGAVQSSVLVTWANPTTAAHGTVGQNVNNLTVGQTYTASFWVMVPSGSPAVDINVQGVIWSPATTVMGTWQQLSVAFTATATTHFIGIQNRGGSSTSGTQVYIAQALVEEGSNVGTYFDGGWLSGFWNNDGTSVLTSQAPQRVNLCTNPSFGAGEARWGFNASGGAVTHIIDTTNAYSGSQSWKLTWTTGSTSANWFASWHDSSQGIDPTQQYTMSCWVYPSAAMTLRGRVDTYTVGGTGVGSPQYGPSIACPANTWTRLYVTMTPLATTYFLYCLPSTLAPIPTGTSINIDAMLLEETASVGDYFDGASPNAAQIGSTNAATPGGSLTACSMSQSVPSQNSNLPVMQVQAWPTQTPYGPTAPVPSSVDNPTVPTTSPLVLSDRTVEITTKRGRQYELDTDQTGSLGLKLDDSDGAVSKLLKPYNNVKVSAFWKGVAYDLWTGFLSVVPTQSENARHAWSQATGVDALDVLANRALLAMQQEDILASNPEVFLPLSDPVGSTGAADITSNGLPTSGQQAPITHFVNDSSGALGAGPIKSTFGASSLCVNGATAWTMGNPSIFNVSYQAAQIQVVGPQNQNGYQLDLTKAWAMECMVSASIASGSNAGKACYAPVFGANQLGNHGGMWFYVDVAPYMDGNGNVSTTLCQVRAWLGPTNYIESGTLSVAQIAKGVYVALTYDGNGTATLIVNDEGISITKTVSSYGFGIANWIQVGSNYDYGVINSGWAGDPNNVFTLQNFAVYGSQLGAPGNAVFLNRYSYGACQAFPSDYARSRIQRVLGWAGVETPNNWWPDGYADLTELSVMADTTGASALSVIQGASQSVLSRLLMDASGRPQYDDRFTGILDTAPAAVFGSRGDLGEIPYTGMPTVAIDPQHTFNDITVTRDGGQVSRATDKNSIAQFFQRSLQVNSDVSAWQDSWNMGWYLLGKYSNPPKRVSTVSFDLAANPSMIPTMLSLRVGDYVQLNHRTTSGAIALDLLVDQISHSISSEKWNMSLELTPFSRYWIAAAARSTISTAVAAGVNSVSIGPMQDASYNPVEASIAVGSKVDLSPGTANAETLTVASVTSNTPGAAGYSSATVTFTAATTKAHAVGDTLCDSLPTGYVDPTTWDAFSILGSTTIPQW